MIHTLKNGFGVKNIKLYVVLHNKKQKYETTTLHKCKMLSNVYFAQVYVQMEKKTSDIKI